MSFLSPWVHSSLRHFMRKSHGEFRANRGNIRNVQSGILQELLGQSSQTEWGRAYGVTSQWSYDDVQNKLPVTEWQHWENWVERQRTSRQAVLAPEIKRYQPTSGSTHKRKWIPYSQKFLREIDRATGVWMFDMYESFPGIRNGAHYWSLSWLPTELRQQMSNNDLSYFPWAKRIFLEQIMAVPERVQNSPSAEAAHRATLEHLILRNDLSLISVWSPTFLLNLCEVLWNERAELVPHIKADNVAELVQKVWPSLSLVSAWDTADAKLWADKLKALFPHVAFQGKGLFATEGVVTIPVDQRMHLAYQSHFYEFQRTDGSIVPSWELKAGDLVTPLISTGSGLWRYQMGDQLLVESIYQGCPILTFVGRKNTVDLVGEKLSYESARDILRQLGAQALLMLAIQGDDKQKPSYEIVWEGEVPAGLAVKGEELLCEHHHYCLARELNQLAPLKVRSCSNAQAFFKQVTAEMNWIAGDVKWEAIVKLPHPLQG